MSAYRADLSIVNQKRDVDHEKRLKECDRGGEEGEEGSQQKHPAISYSVVLHVPLLGLSYLFLPQVSRSASPLVNCASRTPRWL